MRRCRAIVAHVVAPRGDDESVFDLDSGEHVEPRTNRSGCYLIVPRVDEWHTEMVAAELPVTKVEDQPWGMWEFTLTDPSGNYIRIGRTV